jgi:hypothetical protein
LYLLLVFPISLFKHLGSYALKLLCAISELSSTKCLRIRPVLVLQVKAMAVTQLVQLDAELNYKLQQRGELPAGITPESLSHDNCKYKFFFKRGCGRHVAYRTLAAVRRRAANMRCPVCYPDAPYNTKKCGRARVVGKEEARLWEMLDRRSDLAWSAQDRIKGWRGRIDACVYFPLQRWLTIQVDGETHSTNPMKDRGVAEQLAKDARFGEEARQQGRCVLRLDARHSAAAWEAALQQAIASCSTAGSDAELICSTSEEEE